MTFLTISIITLQSNMIFVVEVVSPTEVFETNPKPQPPWSGSP